MSTDNPAEIRLDRRQIISSPVLLGIGAAVSSSLTACTGMPEPQSGTAAADSAGAEFRLTSDGLTINSLRCSQDHLDAEYILPGEGLGNFRLKINNSEGVIWALDTATGSLPVYHAEQLPGGGIIATYTVEKLLSAECRLVPEGGTLTWTIKLINLSRSPLEILDLEVPLPIENCSPQKAPGAATILKHSFISGHGSFLYWMRSNCIGPYLALIPKKNTSLEYWTPSAADDKTVTDPYSVYIHSAAAGEIARRKGCNWRQEHTRLRLAASGSEGDAADYEFQFLWVADQEGMRDLLYENGQLDIHIVPGMTVPTDLPARIAIRSHDKIDRIETEFPDETRFRSLGKRGQFEIFEVAFSRLGENRLTVRHGGTRHTHLEFFVTEPIETLIRKRAAFITAHQIRDESKWYDGLLAEWNMDSHVQLSPDNYDLIKGWRIYAVTCDDPGLSKPAFLASKNAVLPNQAEIAALDYYIDRFVWGGLQRTEEETYTYGVYGIPDWKVNREGTGTGDRPRTEGPLHIWRPYDYPHIFLMYYSMYKVARNHTHIRTELTARDYLTRAAGTAIAMFTIPLDVIDWSAYETGFYNELVVPQIIHALKEEGLSETASTLAEHWRRKIRVFAKVQPDLFISEYSFDSTGFESTYALAHDAMKDPAAAGVTETEARTFLERQLSANLFCRGTIEPAYYILGSDLRSGGTDKYSLTYMAQMGGWAIQEYGLNEAHDPHPYLRLAYASYLSSWALINSGTPQSGYGYWFPGIENDGGAGGGFEAAPFGETWLNQPHSRGSWYYSCEIDLGFCGGVRAARTILADDPIFGRICYGGTWATNGTGIEISLKDGLRKRLSLRLDHASLDLEIETARISAQPIYISDDLSAIRLTAESDNPETHKAMLQIAGLPRGKYELHCNGRVQPFAIASTSSGPTLELELGAVSEGPRDITIQRAA